MHLVYTLKRNREAGQGNNEETRKKRGAFYDYWRVLFSRNFYSSFSSSQIVFKGCIIMPRAGI